MVRTLREAKAKLSELVEPASQGQDVLITVRGKVKARLVAARPDLDAAEVEDWMTELRALRSRYSTGRSSLTIEEALELDREDRS